MDASIGSEFDVQAGKVAPRLLRYFLWQRPLARSLWIACVVFWAVAGLSLFVDALRPVFASAIAGLLYSILFPPLVCLYLLVGWFRQEIDAGRIIPTPMPPPGQRSVGGWSDPASDPLDPRSGMIHWKHFHRNE